MKKKADESDALGDSDDTQPIHGQFGHDGFQHMQNTCPVDDTLPIDDTLPLEFDFDFETQKIDFEDQTCQAIHPFEETQVIDEYNFEGLANDECEDSDKTEILSDTQVLSDDDFFRSSGDCLVDPVNTPKSGFKEQSDDDKQKQSNVKSWGEQHSGSMLGGFTCIRAASIRASGLAARNAALERKKSNSGSTRSENAPQVRISGKDDLKMRHEDNDRQVNESSDNVTMCSSKTVRKLFAEDMVSDGGESGGGVKNCGIDKLLNSFAFENDSGGLSYIDSQEPGELSQAHALDVVNKFLELNNIVGEEDASLKESSGRKSTLSSKARGAQSLAKKVTSTDAKPVAFKWDDNFEDEGGGEFFKNKKELFFGNGNKKRKTSTSQCRNTKSSSAVEKVRIKEKPASKSKTKGLVQSDSKLLSKSSDFVKLNKKSLIDGLNEDTRNIFRDGEVGNEPDNDLPHVLDVGFDTQFAADAMEELRFGVDLSCNDATNNKNEGTKTKRDGFDKGQQGTCSGALVHTKESKKTRNGVQCRSRLSNCSAKELENVNKHLDGQLVGNKPIRTKLRSRGKNLMKNLSTLKTAEHGGEDGVDTTGALDQPAKTEKKSRLNSPLPIARRTRGSLQTSHAKRGKDLNSSKVISDAAMLRNKEKTKAYTSSTLGDESNFCDLSDKPGNVSFRGLNQLNPEIVNYPKKRRTRSQVRCAGQVANVRSKRSKMDVTSSSKINKNNEQNSSASEIPKDSSQLKADTTPNDRCKPSITASKTPVSCATSVDDASPICKGDEYHRQSCRKNLARSALMKEISSLSTSGTEIMSPAKDSRRRRDMANVRVLFSHHMDADIIKQQKKILTRLGASEASSMSDASHFVTEKFVRTKNMLEAIAFGKPVVTQLWLESCGQASCFIDERNYILRDIKKEKEFGFSMPNSLARACQHPLLSGQKVLITPNTKPGKEILVNLVKAVHGSAVERLGRSSLKDKFPDDLLILSCEEDYDICLPLLEKGAAVYSSELLLNGIITQKLQFERHRIFTDKFKETRSTVWLKKDKEFLPVTKGR